MPNQGKMLATRVKNVTLQINQWSSRNRENLMVYALVTGIGICVLGIVLGASGALPGAIVAIGSGLTILLGLIATILAIPGNPFSSLWRRAKRLPVVLLSVATVLLILGVLLLFLPSRNIQPGGSNQTGTPRIDPYIHKGILALDDPLNGSPNTYKWQTTNAYLLNGIDRGSCNFKAQGYQVISLVQQYQTFYCWSQAQIFRDFVYQIHLTLTNNTGGGIVFRLDSQGDFFYFGINSYDEYVLSEVTGGQVKLLLPEKRSPAIKPGLGQTNILAVIADGTQIRLYINTKYIDSTDVNTEAEGYIGVAVVSSTQTPGQVNYTGAAVWSLD